MREYELVAILVVSVSIPMKNEFLLLCTYSNVIPQACDSEEDGLFAFDLHSDGDGQRYVLSSF